MHQNVKYGRGGASGWSARRLVNKIVKNGQSLINYNYVFAVTMFFISLISHTL